MTSLTGTHALIRFILRRDRIRILVWIVAIVVLVALTTVGIEGLFPTQAALDQTAAATEHNAAAIAFNGAAQGLNTVGGQVAFQFGAGGMVLVALMSIFMIGRLTRGDEPRAMTPGTDAACVGMIHRPGLFKRAGGTDRSQHGM